MGGEDFGEYGRTPDKIPICIFWLGAVEPERMTESARSGRALPPLHSSLFRPAPEPTLKTGVTAMTARGAWPGGSPGGAGDWHEAGRDVALVGRCRPLRGRHGHWVRPIFVRLSETGPTATAFYRLLFALPCLWLWMGIEQARHPALVRPSNGADFAWLGAAGLLFTADLSIWHWSLQFTSVTDSTLITNIAPLFVTLGAWLFLGERITARFLIGMGVAIAGGILLAGASYSVSSRHLLGDGLSLLAALFYAGYLLLLKRLRRSFSTPVIMAWAGLASGVGFGVVAWLSGDRMHADTAQGWWVLVGLALVSHVGGQTLIAFGFGHLPASFSSVSLLWQPVVAAVAAWLVLGEPVRWVQAIGAVVELLGIGWAGTPPAQPAPSPATEP